MTGTARQRWALGIGLAAAGGCLVYALRGVSFTEIASELSTADWRWLVAMTVAALFTFHLRAMRWNVLLAPSCGSVPFSSRFAAVCIGFMVNNVLPARLGEVARAASLARIEGVGVGRPLASLVLERLLDAVILMGLLMPAVIVQGGGEFLGDTMQAIIGVMAVGAPAALIALAMIARWREPCIVIARRILERFKMPRAAAQADRALRPFMEGLGALTSAHQFFRALVWSAVVWLWNGVSFYLGFLAFGVIGPGFPGALLVQTASGVAVAAPSTPGFFGVFEAAVRLALEVYRVEPATIISYAVGYHILNYIPITILGICYMKKLGIRRDDFRGLPDDSSLEGRSLPGGKGVDLI